MTEADIVHENGVVWVAREKDRYTVMRPYGAVASQTDSSYEKTPDGLSQAVTRCAYLAKVLPKASR